jgi:hypothetical protein
VWGAGNSPIATFVATITIAGSEVVEVIVVYSWMSTDVSTSPALAGEGKADSPTAAAGR